MRFHATDYASTSRAGPRRGGERENPEVQKDLSPRLPPILETLLKRRSRMALNGIRSLLKFTYSDIFAIQIIRTDFQSGVEKHARSVGCERDAPARIVR
jgi:hypothetical protein